MGKNMKTRKNQEKSTSQGVMSMQWLAINRIDAIKWIKEIQNGAFKRNEIDVPKGRIAISCWNDPMFGYGMEYGAILAIMKIFNISSNEL